MWNKLLLLPHTIFFKLTQFLRTLKSDERGLSGVVVAILLILVAVLAIVMIWVFLGEWLSELWDNITGQAGNIS